MKVIDGPCKGHTLPYDEYFLTHYEPIHLQTLKYDISHFFATNEINTVSLKKVIRLNDDTTFWYLTHKSD